MTGSLTTEAGIADFLTIDGVDFPIPAGYAPSSPLAQSQFQTMAGSVVIQAAYRGDGMPDRPDSFTFPLPYSIGDSNAALADQIELLRKMPGPHFLADWKQRIEFYTLRANQSLLYLPREDASQAGVTHSGVWKSVGAAAFVLSWTNVAQTVRYKPSVSSGDVVPPNEIWISTSTILHPDSGRVCVPFKLGSPPSSQATLTVRYFSLFRVDVVDVQTDFSDLREDKVLILTEVN